MLSFTKHKTSFWYMSSESPKTIVWKSNKTWNNKKFTENPLWDGWEVSSISRGPNLFLLQIFMIQENERGLKVETPQPPPFQNMSCKIICKNLLLEEHLVDFFLHCVVVGYPYHWDNGTYCQWRQIFQEQRFTLKQTIVVNESDEQKSQIDRDESQQHSEGCNMNLQI